MIPRLAARQGAPALAARCASRAPLAVLLALLAACATPPPPAPVEPGVQQWSGRFSATVSYDPAALRAQSAEGGPPPSTERLAGRFRLSAGGGASELELASPLGQTLARARADANGATATTSDGRTYRADTAEALTEQVFRIRLPVGRLPRWLGGRLTAPPIDTVQVDGTSRPAHAIEDDWELHFESWQATAPARLVIDWPATDPPSVPSATVRRLNIRLVVDSHDAGR